MVTISEATGKALEYCRYQLNIYQSCSNQCIYCYANMLTSGRPKEPRKNILEETVKFLSKHPNFHDEVLFSFLHDPYMQENIIHKTTRQFLELFLKCKIPVQILTKNGANILQDEDLILKFGKNIKIGCTLVFDNQADTEKYEPETAGPEERLEVLKRFHDKGVYTWVSFEPVIYFNQTLNLIEKCSGIIDKYKIGKLNNCNKFPDADTDWSCFLKEALELVKGKNFYIKKDLALYGQGLFIEEKNLIPEYKTTWED